MNCPFDEIYDTRYSYGRLLFPLLTKDRWGYNRWIGYFGIYGFKMTSFGGFTNIEEEIKIGGRDF
jgi:hypothetical protein